MITLKCDNSRLDSAFQIAERYFNYDRARPLQIQAFAEAECGYSVSRDGDACRLQYASKSDFFAGVCALLSNLEGKAYTEARKPVCDRLGLMLDCARNGVMQMDAIERFTVNAACLGYNYLELYTEDCMEIPGEPFFGYQRGAYTEQELKQADAFCAQLGIELVPCIQTLAHLNQALRWPAYNAVWDCNDILLAEEEKTYALIERMIAQARKCFSSNRINIGMDEAHFVGLGKYLDRNGYRNRFNILERHLKRVSAICEKYGFRPAMWSDMYFRLAFGGEYYAFGKKLPKEVVERVPEGVDLIYWDYYNTDEEKFGEMIRMHRQTSRPCVFAGGLWCWNGFAPCNGFTMKSMEPALNACRGEDVRDVFFTLWGDNGAECSRFSVLSSQAKTAELLNETPDLNAADRRVRLLTGYGAEEFDALDLPNRVGDVTGDNTHNPCKYLLYSDPLAGLFDCYVQADFQEQYAAHASRLETLSKRSSAYAYLFDTLGKLCRVLVRKSTLGLRLKAAYDADNKQALRMIAESEIPALLERLQAFYTAFSVQWDKEYKSFGFEIQDARLGGLAQRLKHTAEILQAYAEGKTSRIAELEQPRLKPYEGNSVSYNLYIENISAGKL